MILQPLLSANGYMTNCFCTRLLCPEIMKLVFFSVRNGVVSEQKIKISSNSGPSEWNAIGS